MKEWLKRFSIVLSLFLVLSVLLLFPGLPWSAQCSQSISKAANKLFLELWIWRGIKPQNLKLAGKIIKNNQEINGVEIELLNSDSGWAAMTNETGDFSLPFVKWHPHRNYTLLITLNDYQSRQITIPAPKNYPKAGVLELGTIEFEKTFNIADVELLKNISLLTFDKQNQAYYQEIFDKLTAQAKTDEEKISNICHYVNSKLLLPETDNNESIYFTKSSPKQILERGSQYCGNLALAMMTIAEAGNYKTRLIDLIDEKSLSISHTVVEVFYQDRWHVYDPVTGNAVKANSKRVLSYKEIKLDKTFYSANEMPKHLFKIAADKDWTNQLYSDNFHHYYYFREK